MDIIQRMIANFILEQIKEGGIDRLIERIEHSLVPLLRYHKNEIIKYLRRQKLNDDLVSAVEILFDALIPDCATCLADVPRNQAQREADPVLV